MLAIFFKGNLENPEKSLSEWPRLSVVLKEVFFFMFFRSLKGMLATRSVPFQFIAHSLPSSDIVGCTRTLV